MVEDKEAEGVREVHPETDMLGEELEEPLPLEVREVRACKCRAPG